MDPIVVSSLHTVANLFEDFQHAIFLRSLGGKLFRAPIPKDVQEVLDVGKTATGTFSLFIG